MDVQERDRSTLARARVRCPPACTRGEDVYTLLAWRKRQGKRKNVACTLCNTLQHRNDASNASRTSEVLGMVLCCTMAASASWPRGTLGGSARNNRYRCTGRHSQRKIRAFGLSLRWHAHASILAITTPARRAQSMLSTVPPVPARMSLALAAEARSFAYTTEATERAFTVSTPSLALLRTLLVTNLMSSFFA